MSLFYAFFVAVMANVVSYYICKGIDLLLNL